MSPRNRIVRPSCAPEPVPVNVTMRPEVDDPRAIPTSSPRNSSNTAAVVSGRSSPSSGLA